MRSQIKNIDKAIALYNYYKELPESKIHRTYNMSTLSRYAHFIKDDILYEVRISDHHWHINLSKKTGYTVSKLTNDDAVLLNVTVISEISNETGVVIKSDKHLTTVRYASGNLVIYPTSEIKNRIIHTYNELIKDKFKVDDIPSTSFLTKMLNKFKRR